MRYSTRLTLVFLLVLYIGPMIFISSYSHTAILAEPNLIKDFSPSAGEGWLDGWDYRQGISITGSSGAGNNYQVKLDVTYDANMQTDFDDLRVTDDGGQTELDYWIQVYTVSTSAVVWVEVADNLNTSQIIYMYCGNSEVSTTSNGTATFLFFDDFNDDSLDGEKWAEISGLDTGSYEEASGKLHITTIIGQLQSMGSVGLDFGPNVALLSHLKWNEVENNEFGFDVRGDNESMPGDNGTAKIYRRDDGKKYASVNDDGTELSSRTSDFSSVYRNIEFQWTPTSVNFVDDGSLAYTHTTRVPDADMGVFLYVSGTGNDAWLNWVAVRKFVATEPVAVFGLWNEVGEAILYFSVSFDMWGYNTGLIILGLVMIPVSTIYLAYGAKHDRSSDRLFYGLIIFMLGCGLFIGGIMP